MKLLIFGATGTIGRQVVWQALEQGHTVTAFVRDPAKLEIQHLKIFQGDVLDFRSVQQAVQQQEVVLIYDRIRSETDDTYLHQTPAISY
jgi:putative NADH-flavin reductase